MIPRFYEVSDGAIKVDGTDIRDLTLKSLRDNIAVVFQDNFLFSGPIRDNILLGKFDATDAEIKRAVKSACLEEFINDLENGLDTDIGERGTLLSGGQKQRIAIARAVINKPDLLLADEPTGNVDDAMAARILHLFVELNKLGTTLVIATHNQSLVREFNKPQIHLNSGEVEIIQPLMDLSQYKKKGKNDETVSD